ncbi:putative membrane protein [Candidatus Nitrosopumilus salaria BD31]|uniref:Membrane protein n=1 Tax=Candidatus Nitrosopumilus salarius BD31 TaxID=859350 RepID=I3D202_9ARCH|nr:hypothetical protein [Candidatus Nitrosopumilus salaria]EIJ65745.1 putative membrane protein [Candidatus Nitrosopumilus salaria BD31]
MGESPQEKTLSSMRKDTFLPLLVGFAIASFVTGVESFRVLVAGNYHNQDFDFNLLIFPIIFYMTNMRFVIGNLLHITASEQNEGHSWASSWTVMIVQHTILVVLGLFIYQGSEFFFLPILLILLVFDIIWVASMNIYKKIRHNESDWTPSIGWVVINSISTGVILFLMYNPWVKPFSDFGYMILLSTFTVAAVADFVLTVKRHKKLFSKNS